MHRENNVMVRATRTRTRRTNSEDETRPRRPAFAMTASVLRTVCCESWVDALDGLSLLISFTPTRSLSTAIYCRSNLAIEGVADS